MNKTTEALKLAEEALLRSNGALGEYTADTWRLTMQDNDEALAVIREALAEPVKQEPVAYTNKEQVNELIKESARLIGSIKDEGDQYLTAIDALRNAYRVGLKDSPVDAKAIRA